MKTVNIKHFLLCLFWGIGFLFANAQGLTVHMKDGTSIKVPYEQLDSISTYLNDEEPISIVGTWRCNTDDGYKTLTFNNNGTGIDYEYWEYDNDFSSVNFAWKTKGNVLTFIYDDEENSVITCTYVVSPEILIINWGQESESYVKSAGENEDPNSDSNYPIRGPIARSFKGNGTKSDPYIISKASELRKLADDVSDKGKAYVGAYFSLTADITINKNVLDANGELSGYGDALEEWKPIGMQDKEQFQGTFNGNGHIISGIYINKKDASHMALFYGGRIQNLTIKDSYIEGDGWIASFGGNEIYNCVNYGTIKGYTCSGIGGLSSSSIINNCKNYGKVHGQTRVAGISLKATIDKCINYGEIKSTTEKPSSYASGIGGDSGTHGPITNSCNMGRVIGKRVAGIMSTLTQSPKSNVINNINYGALEGTYGGGIICNAVYSASMENNVNVGRNEGGAETYGLYYIASETNITAQFKNNFYLSASYLSMGENKKGYNGVNNKGMTEEEMKSQAFLDELNRNARALGSEYSRWKFGKDGFPILEWIEE